MKLKKLIKNQNRTINLQMLIMMSMAFIFLGATCNHLAIKNNEGRMPVLETDWEYKTETHISYQNSDEVKYAFLSDRFHFPGYTYSIGDALMILFGISGLCMCILATINVRKCDKLI